MADIQKCKELCERIKEELVKQGKDSFILYVAETNDMVSESDLPEDLYWDIDAHGQSQLAGFETGSYYRAIGVDGLYIEEDKLKFYLSEYNVDENGDAYQATWQDDFENLMKGWWSKSEDFRPEEVLEYYLQVMDDIANGEYDYVEE